MNYLACISKKRTDIQFFYICLLISFIYIFPLITSDIYYLDDLGRVIYGTMWNHDARYLSNVIYYILTFGSKTLNISPYPQVLSIIVFSLSSLIIVKSFKLNTDIISAIGCSLLLTSPFYIENLSYKLDSLTMSIGIFFCIYAIYLSSLFNYKKSIISVFLLMGTLYLYEPSLGIFITLSIAMFICNIIFYNNYKAAIKTSLLQISIITISLAIWKALSYLPGFYIRSSITSSDNIIQFLTWKIDIYIDTFNLLFNDRFLLSYSPLFILSIISFFYYYIIFVFNNNIKKTIFVSILILFSIPLFFLMAQGVSFFSFWKTDDFGFAPRVFIGFGASLLTISIFIIKSKLFNNTIKFIIFILPFMYSLTLISTYCNASKSQLRILNVVANNLSRDITKYNLNNKNMVVIGKMPDSYELSHSGNENPIIFKLIQTPLHDQWSWGYRQLIALYSIPVLYPSNEQFNIARNELCNFKKLNSNLYYDLLLSSKNDFFVMDFSKKCN